MTKPTDHPPSDRSRSVATDSPRRDEAAALRTVMECIVLPARPGAPPSSRPPVEIYLGTEPAQYRANRVFGWSIEKVRDPGREVRIHVMSELEGFDRRGWTTGFTNYRFAIPALAGGRGRAIYNDEDQIYLTDPGVLFDLDMGGAAYLATSDSESSVMLVDCERMASVWTLEEARHRWKRALLRKATKASGLRGDLDPGWNARDEEFEPGRSHLLHYTTLHTQPWRPFPERFVYQRGSYTQLWHDLEREAIEQGFEIFDREAPSRGFRERLERLAALPRSEMGSGIGVSGELAGAVEDLARRSKASSLLELAPDLRGDDEQRPGRFGLDLERRLGLLELLGAAGAEERFDGVLCVDGLEDLPAWDVPWLVEELFRRAHRFVFVAVRCPESRPRRRVLLPPQGTVHTPDWWRSHFEAAARRHPEISWQLMTARGPAFAPDRILLRRGGPRPDPTPPRVWTLTDGEPGNETQVSALAQALGWPWEPRRPALGPLAGLPFSGQGAHLGALRATSRGRDALQAPWPDLLIVAGRKVAAVARWVRERSQGRTLVVALGAKAGTPPEGVDLAVTPRSLALFPHPNRIEIERPLVPEVPTARPGPAAERGRQRVQAVRGPRWALLIGSGTRALGLDRASAEALGRLVADSAAGLGASVLISGSRHAAPEVFEGCAAGVGRGAALIHRATPNQPEQERLWPALLELCDVFVLVGLGETTLTELCSTGRPVFLAPQLPVRAALWPQLRDAFAEAVVRRAQARPANDRGTTRPQEGLELLCARLVARGWVRPRRDAEALRGRLVRRGHARLLRAPIRAGDLEGFAPPPSSDLSRVADRVRTMLGVEPEHAIDPAEASESGAEEPSTLFSRSST
jgi:mitochondrial fission protein ELM1